MLFCAPLHCRCHVLRELHVGHPPMYTHFTSGEQGDALPITIAAITPCPCIFLQNFMKNISGRHAQEGNTEAYHVQFDTSFDCSSRTAPVQLSNSTVCGSSLISSFQQRGSFPILANLRGVNGISNGANFSISSYNQIHIKHSFLKLV